MRIMMVSTPFGTHLAPTVPFLWALRAAGHEVIVVGQPEIVEAANAAGLCAASVGHRFYGMDILRLGLVEGRRPLEVFGRPDAATKSGTWSVHAGYLLPSYLEFAERWRPDLVVFEQFELTGTIVAGALGVPAIGHRLGVDPLSGPARELGRVVLDAACRRLGLDGLPEPTAWLDPCPPGLQLDGVPAGRPIRAVPYNGAGSVPEWAGRTAERQVCVCFGRIVLALNGARLLRSVVDAFDGLEDVRAIVAVEPEFAAELGPVPRGVRVVPPTPLHLFLGHCDAVLHHGGVGSMMTALSFGLPQLLLPQANDQFAAARSLSALGAARVLDDPDRQNDPACVREELSALLARPRYGEAAVELREAMSRMPSPAAVARDLDAVLSVDAMSAVG